MEDIPYQCKNTSKTEMAHLKAPALNVVLVHLPKCLSTALKWELRQDTANVGDQRDNERQLTI